MMCPQSPGGITFSHHSGFLPLTQHQCWPLQGASQPIISPFLIHPGVGALNRDHQDQNWLDSLESLTCPSSQQAPRLLVHHKGAGCSPGLLGECWQGPRNLRRGVPGLPFALGAKSAQRAGQYLALSVG